MKLVYVYWIVGIVVAIIGVSILLLVTSISRYAAYWSHLPSQAPANNAITYVALGDSTAQGIGATSPGRGYVGQIAERLAKQQGRPVHIINVSKTGAKIADVLQVQLPELKSLKPDIVTIEIGANDIKDFDSARFTNQVKELFDNLPAGTYISDLPYFGGRSRFLDPVQEHNVQKANVILASVARAHRISLVPLHQATLARNKYPWDYAIDYFHPNNIGYRAWTDAFWNKIKLQQ